MSSVLWVAALEARRASSNSQISIQLATLSNPVMTTSTLASAASPSISGLIKEVAKKFESSVQSGQVQFFPSTVCTLPLSSRDYPNLRWQIRNVPALLKKPKPSDADSDAQQEEHKSDQQQNPTDVFAAPYVDGLLVGQLGDHVALLNKYSVLPRHFLLVTSTFETQNLPPSPSTLALSYRILLSHNSKNAIRSNTEIFSFYNCGPLSGASQPHRHLQFVEVGGEKFDEVGNLIQQNQDDEQEDDDDDEEGDEEEGGAGGRKVPIPIDELLKRIEKDGKEHEHVHALPLPYQHFAVLLSPSRLKKSSSSSTESYLASKMLSLLDAMFRAKLSLSESSGDLSNGKRGAPSFNLILTRRAMHLIPRKQEDVIIPASKGKDEEGREIGKLSLNAMGYAGFLLTKSPLELEALRKVEGGIQSILAEAGVEPVADVSVASEQPEVQTETTSLGKVTEE